MPSYGGAPETIGDFELSPDGSLTTVPGSPFPAEEGGPGGILGLGFTPDGRHAASNFLFTGGIQGYSLAPGGAISLTNSLTTAQATGIAVSPDGRFAFMPTRNPVAEGVTRFSIGGDGSLSRLEPSSGTGASYEVAVTPNGRFLYTVKEGEVLEFGIGSDGALTSIGAAEAPSARYLGVSPDGRFLFVTLSEGLRTLSIGSDGRLTPVGAPLTIGGGSLSIDFFGIAPDGTHVYLPDSNEDKIYSVAIGADGSPSLAGEVAVENPEGVGVSPDGRFLATYSAFGPYGIRVVAVEPAGSLTLLSSFVEFESGEPEPLVFQPQPTPVARFSAAAAVAGAATRFDAGGSERATHYEWSFGDGTTLADGGPTPAHTYAHPGTYQVTLAVADAQGCSASQIYTGQSTVCPGGAVARTATSVTVPSTTKPKPKPNARPMLGKLRAVPRAFAPKLRGLKPGKVKLGTTFNFTVSEPSTVRFKFERKQGKRFKRLGSRSKAAKAGKNKLKWNGKLKGKPLPPGRYRATVVATDKEGARSAPKTVGFRILSVLPPR